MRKSIFIAIALFQSAGAMAASTCTFDFSINVGKGQPLETCTAEGTGRDRYAARLDAEGGCLDQIKRGRIITTAAHDCRVVSHARPTSAQSDAGSPTPNGG